MGFNNTTEVQRTLEQGWMMTLATLAALGTMGNLLIIAAVCLSQRLRVKGHAFTVNLAVADLVITCYIMPIGLATSQFKVNPFSDGLCGFNAFLIMTSCGVSTQTLMLIALERYFHICKTLYYRRFFSKHLIGIYIALTWVYSAAWTCQGWTGWTQYIYGLDIWVCIFDGTYRISYNVCLVLFGMLIPMAILFFCYIKIFMLVHKNNQAFKKHRQVGQGNHMTNRLMTDNQKRAKKQLRLTLTLLIIVVVFCVSWIPASVVLLMSGTWTTMPKLFYTVAVWFAFTNSCMNSVLYGFLNKNFRDGYKRVLVIIFCCCKKNDKEDCQCHSCASSEEMSSSKQHSNDTAKTDTLNKRKIMVIQTAQPSVMQHPRPVPHTRPNSVSDISIDPMHLWSPDELDRSRRYVESNDFEEIVDVEASSGTALCKDVFTSTDINSSSASLKNYLPQTPALLIPSNSKLNALQPPTPGSVDMETPFAPTVAKSKITTILHMKEGVLETGF